MGMVVKNNMSAVRTLNTLNSNTSALQKSLQKVSSGMKINSAQDDASGYAISERMRVRIRSLDQANQNSQNDSSLMKTAEGAVGNTVEILRALKEKAINAANDSNTDEDRQTIQKEINQFIDQIDDNALVQFNGKYLVDGSKNNAFFETKSILLNQSLRTGTTSTSALTELANRAGDSLGIQTTDQYQVSWVQNGTIHFTSGRVGTKAISDILTITPEGGSTPVSQVAETTSKGLIAAAKELEDSDNTPYNKPMTYNSAEQSSFQAVIDAWTKQDGTPSAGGFKKLDEILDTTTNKPLFAATTNGETFGSTVQIEFNDGKYSIPQLTSGTSQIYNLNTNYTDTTQYTYENKVAYTGQESVADELGAPFVEANIGKTLSELGYAAFTAGQTSLGTDTEVSAAASYKIAKITAAGANQGKFYLDDGSGNAVSTAYDLYTKSEVKNESGLENAYDKFGKAVYTPDKTEGIAFGAKESGVDNQISGLTINILDQDGNVKKAANAALDQFKQYQRAENETGDMSLNFHIGSEANVSFKVGMGDMRSQALGLKGSDGTRIDVYTKEHANAAINVIENALTKALDQQTTIGAIEARLEYTSTNLTTSSENVQAAESTIRDADMAKEMTNYTKSNVLLQAAQAMLAQANQNSSAVLSLLQ